VINVRNARDNHEFGGSGIKTIPNLKTQRIQMAGKVLWHVTMSLDGFISGSNDSMDWVFEYATEPSPDAIEVIGATGAILAGRRWWDVAQAKYRRFFWWLENSK
jgi:hypothetical protein